jgi:tRNA (guanine10-N2)-dimethyltransferase
VKLLLELSMECESLARAEALAAARALGGGARVIEEDRGVLVMETKADPKGLASRLGLCHFVDEWLWSGAHADLEPIAKEIDVEGPIRVRSTKVGNIRVDLAGTSRKLGKVIGEHRGVDLHEPRSDIRVVYSGRVHLGRTLGTVDRASFEMRKNRYMPFVYPASLHPKFARAMVNLTEVRPGGRMLDPFCGTGAILAEASLVGLRPVGTDFSEKMIEGANLNLKHLGLNAQTRVCDVGEVARAVGAVDGIATDPPYGRSTSTKGEPISDLYERAFTAFSEILRRGAKVTVAVPDTKLIERTDTFRLKEKHALWVHRSLTRNFCVLEKI